MRKIFQTTIFLGMLLCLGFSQKSAKVLVEKNFEMAEKQYSNMVNDVENQKKSPRTIQENGSLALVSPKDWTSGFFPGCLWLLYEYSNDGQWESAARKFTSLLADERFNHTTHDMGFKMYCSYGNGLRLTGDTSYDAILTQSARTLVTRFNAKVGCIRSWDHNKNSWQFPVIIDNMMNLELLFWAFRTSGDSSFYKIATTHANTTIKNFFRTDFSTWHVVNFDTLTGVVIDKQTHQGYADSSTWARGQAWALYGFTMCYRETGNKNYLLQAQKIAKYILNHKNLPADKIPYWDFNAPDIPNAQRDVSAAAIICSALYELSSYTGDAGKKYRQIADQMLAALSTSNYCATGKDSRYFLLQHAVGNFPKNSEINVPIIYADYYFLEANLRKMKFEGIQ